MAIELKELIVKAIVGDGDEKKEGKKSSIADAENIKEQLIKACVDEVMERLERQLGNNSTSLSRLSR